MPTGACAWLFGRRPTTPCVPWRRAGRLLPPSFGVLRVRCWLLSTTGVPHSSFWRYFPACRRGTGQEALGVPTPAEILPYYASCLYRDCCAGKTHCAPRSARHDAWTRGGARTVSSRGPNSRNVKPLHRDGHAAARAGTLLLLAVSSAKLPGHSSDGSLDHRTCYAAAARCTSIWNKRCDAQCYYHSRPVSSFWPGSHLLPYVVCLFTACNSFAYFPCYH